MKITLKYPDGLGKETEDEIVDWMMEIVKNPPPLITYSPLNYVLDMEVER